MVQLMLGWHPAGIEDNHLSAKVIISYKWKRTRYSFHTHFILISLKNLKWAEFLWLYHADVHTLLLSFGISTKRQCIILRSHHNLGLISVIIGKGSLERPEQRELQLKGSTVSVRNLFTSQNVCHCSGAAPVFTIMLFLTRCRLFMLAFQGVICFYNIAGTHNRYDCWTRAGAARFFWELQKGEHPKHADLW